LRSHVKSAPRSTSASFPGRSGSRSMSRKQTPNIGPTRIVCATSGSKF
jgi:hypothetical protein